MLNFLIIDNIIKEGLKEDAPFGDVTTDSIISPTSICKVNLIAKEDGIICGFPVFKRVFDILGNVKVEAFKKDGDTVYKGEKIALVTGNTRNVLIGERIALNLMQRMSGIATTTKAYSDAVKDSKAKIVDTRKITPLYRHLDKYAVLCGGGHNHRFSLSDSVLIKDNHIDAAGGIVNAVNLARKNCSFTSKIEVETETKSEVLEAIIAKADIIMLDNMTPDMVAEMVKLINGKAIIECSGNMNLDTVADYARAGVDYISVGALTHSFNAFDISLKELEIISE